MIEIADLSKSFDGKAVLRGVNLRVETGESLTIIGGSGSGKSVLLKCILGLMTPDAGTVTFDQTALTPRNRPDFLDRFGMLFQGAALFDSLPVWQNVAFRLLQKGMTRPKAKARAIDKLERVGLGPDTADRYPSELSGGMQKRAGLARAIADDPQVIFFDEPTTGLDPILAQKINRLIRSIVQETGATTITITHDLGTVRTVSDKVAVLRDGQIGWQGATSDIPDTTDSYLQDFIRAGSHQH